MRVAVIGLGNLGLPLAAVLAEHHDVVGYDLYQHRCDLVADPDHDELDEPGLADLLGNGQIGTAPSIEAAVGFADVIFVAVQTPHGKGLGGETLPAGPPTDFDYRWLTDACGQVAAAAALRPERRFVLAVVSTVMPGTLAREVEPGLPANVDLVYNPSFIAMGSVVADLAEPEFVLIGERDRTAGETVSKVWRPVFKLWAPTCCMPIESAELTKVAYNTYLGLKIDFANTMAIVADATGADVDHVTWALGLAHKRLLSTAYMRAGMGDGGGCHPRDNVAMSWLARDRLPYDLFGDVMGHRVEHAVWIAEIVLREARERRCETVIVLGRAYKPGTRITAGSASLLLIEMLRTMGLQVISYDCMIDDWGETFRSAIDIDVTQATYVIATPHPGTQQISFGPTNTVVDPWGFMLAENVPGKLVRPGRR